MGRPPKEVSLENIHRFQLELEMAGQDIGQLLKDKKGRSRACLLCQRRKQKCDHKLPSCTACLKAHVKCVQPARYRDGSSQRTTRKGLKSKSSALDQDQNTQNFGTSVVKKILDNPFANVGSDELAKKPIEYQQPNRCQFEGKDEYTLLLEKKIKFLETMLDLNSQSSTYKEHLRNYEKMSHLLDNSGPEEASLSAQQQCNLDFSSTSMASIEQYPQIKSSMGQAKFQPLNEHPSIDSFATSPIFPLLPKPKFRPLNQQRSSLQSTFDIVKPRHSHKKVMASLTSDTLESIDYSTCIFSKYNLKEFLSYDPAFEFDEQLSRAFLESYFTRLQFKYPFLDEQEIYTFHDNYINNNVYSYSATEFHFSCGRMWLIFSISACLHKTTGKYWGLSPNRYFSTAIRHITKCGSNLSSLQHVEALCLLVLYLLRTDRDSMCLYDIIKDAMGICKDKLFLNKWNPLYAHSNKNVRLFWSVYVIERMICVPVGKPYTVSESEIDLPLVSEHMLDTNATNRDKGQSAIHFFVQSLKLRRIESKFVEELNIVPQDENVPASSNNMGNQKKQIAEERSKLTEQLPLVKKYFKELEHWRSDCIICDVRNFQSDTLKLYYYMSVRLLLQPYLELLEPHDRLFKECQAAAGQICQLYRIFHQKTVFGHSTPAVHTVFVAGVTLVYCLWLARNWNDKRRRQLGDMSKHTRPLVGGLLFSTMDDLRACSVCMYVMAERSKFAIIFRDTFDQLMNATIGNLIERCGPDSSELIYVTNPIKGHTSPTLITIHDEHDEHDKVSMNNSKKGMPPAVKRTYGRIECSEHVCFDEKTQFDFEEQMERRRKQGVLQKTSVPKSLSHLLSDVEPFDAFSNKKNQPSGINKNGGTSSVNREDSCTETADTFAPSSTFDKINRYIVKKPSNLTESDWEVFQQQAFLQQRHAQQNLQTYLSFLNRNFKTGEAERIICSNSIDEKPQYRPSPSEIQFTHPLSSSFSNSSNFSRNENPCVISDPNKTTTTAFDSVPKEKTRNLILRHLTPFHPIDPPMENSSMLSENGILFDSGTHNMINNISTWTSDSVLDLINNGQNLDTVTTPPTDLSFNPSQQNSMQRNHRETNIIPSRDNNPGTSSSPMGCRNSSFTNSLPSPFNQGKPNNFIIPHHSPSQKHTAPASTTIDSTQPIPTNHKTIQNTTQIRNMPSIPVEDFWTAHSKYNFTP